MYKHITSYKLVALNCIRWIYQFKKVHDIHIFIRYRTVMLLRSFVSFQKFCVCCTLAACLLLVFIIFLYPRVYSNMWFVVFFFLKSIQLASSEQSFLIQQNTIGYIIAPCNTTTSLLHCVWDHLEFIHLDKIVVIRLQSLIPRKMWIKETKNKSNIKYRWKNGKLFCDTFLPERIQQAEMNIINAMLLINTYTN